jgi:hypothetical protein
VGSVFGHPFFWVSVVKCAIAAWLLLGSRGIAQVVLKLRKRDPEPVQMAADKAGGPL